MLVAIAVLTSFLTASHAQQITREQTVQKISKALSEINSQNAQIKMSSTAWEVSKAAMDRIVKIAVDLANDLATNPYVRVKGFTIGFPSGVAVEFEWKASAPREAVQAK
jgi:hypothetical protein